MMDQGFRFLVIAVFTYLIFLCVIRIVLGKQYKTKSFLIDIVGIVTVYGSFLISKYGNFMKLPAFLYYALPLVLSICIPPLALRMKSDQVLKYLALGILVIPFVHIFFSLFFGWGDMVPFVRIPSLWSV